MKKKVAVKCDWSYGPENGMFYDCKNTEWSQTHRLLTPKQDGYNFCPTCGKKINFLYKGLGK